jgi:hypothetical protein
VFEKVTAAVIVGAFPIPLVPALRRRAVMREATKVARAAYPAEPGSDWPVLYTRLASRDRGSRIGALVFVGAVVAIVLAADLPEPFVVLGFVMVSTGQSVGALVGHLLGVHRSDAVARVAALRQRRLGQYLLPLEARLCRAVLVVPLAGVALGTAWWLVEPRAAGSAGGVLGASLVCLVLVVLSAPLALRTLQTSTPVTTDGGLLWGELLRATLLRDAYAGIRGVAACGTVIALFVVVFSGQGPRWFIIVAVSTMVVAVGLTSVLGLVSSADSMHAWARGHVLPEAA